MITILHHIDNINRGIDYKYKKVLELKSQITEILKFTGVAQEQM